MSSHTVRPIEASPKAHRLARPPPPRSSAARRRRRRRAAATSRGRRPVAVRGRAARPRCAAAPAPSSLRRQHGAQCDGDVPRGRQQRLELAQLVADEAARARADPSAGSPSAPSRAVRPRPPARLTAFAAASSTRRRLPARSPTVGLTWASAILMRARIGAACWRRQGDAARSASEPSRMTCTSRCGERDRAARGLELLLEASGSGRSAAASSPRPLHQGRTTKFTAGVAELRDTATCSVPDRRAPARPPSSDAAGSTDSAVAEVVAVADADHQVGCAASRRPRSSVIVAP